MSDGVLADSLFACDEPEPAPLAIVFASEDRVELRQRADRGAELHAQGLAVRLLLTGGGNPTRKRTEADEMAAIAMGHGTPEAALLLEDASTNTFENVLLSYRLLEARSLLGDLHTILLVSSAWHMRRVRLTMMRTFPSSTRLLCCPTVKGCTAESWRASAACRRRVEAEARILEAFLDAGLLPDPNSP